MTTKEATSCNHKAGYRMADGVLACMDCGAPSQSPKWPTNVYGVEEAKRLHTAVEDKALHGLVEEKPYSPIIPPGQRNRVKLTRGKGR